MLINNRCVLLVIFLATYWLNFIIMRQYLVAHPIKSFVFLLAILQLGLLGLYFFQLQNGIDFKGHLVGRDFVNMYLGGDLIGKGQVDVLFSQDRYWDALRDWLGEDYLIHNWSYPPTMFWVAELLAKLPYYLAYFVWTFGGVLVLGFALRTLGLSWLWAMAVVLSPAGFWNILAGQNAFYISGFLIFSLGASWDNKKLPAGIFWALATVKPHLGLLAIPLLVGKKRYGVIVTGGIILVALMGIVLLRYGIEPWQKFFLITVTQQRFVLENWHGLVEIFVPTGFMQGRLLGLSVPFSYALHGCVAVVTLGMLVRAWPSKTADKRYWISWFAIGTYLLLPYSFMYDFMLFQVVLLLWRDDLTTLFRVKNEEVARGIWIFLWMSPLILVAVVAISKIQLMPVVLLWLLWNLGSKSAGVDEVIDIK